MAIGDGKMTKRIVKVKITEEGETREARITIVRSHDQTFAANAAMDIAGDLNPDARVQLVNVKDVK